jgi:hypothetical protein
MEYGEDINMLSIKSLMKIIKRLKGLELKE